ncbi:MAG TPA: flagellar biosynthesis protein FlhB [Solirubrobacteraceae bacterium]|nr:flagellar biosynthesis protein FlhB [Solirubrobacteraceae bacterium]
MADPSKTEKATPKRRNESRKQGNVAKSTDVNSAVVLAAGLVGLTFMGPKLIGGVSDAMRNIFAQISHPGAATTAAGLHALMQIGLTTVLTTVAPIAGMCLFAGVVANVAQVGFKPTTQPLKPNFKKLNPVTGFKNTFFSTRMPFEGAKAIAKVGAVGAVVALALIPQLTHLGASVGTPPAALGSLIGSSVMGIAERATVAYLLIAVADLIWQRRKHAKSLRMTKQEVKEEFKQTQLPPEVKSALRRRQVQAARARMMAAIPQADVVVTNPTHFAVALQYDGSHPAPVVVAKGQDLVAKQIRRIADENNVPIVPDPPLARSLHKSVEIGQMIPAELFAAVAQVLAFVYKMAGRRRAAR